MNDGLRVNYNIDIVVTGTEEVMSFNDLLYDVYVDRAKGKTSIDE